MGQIKEKFVTRDRQAEHTSCASTLWAEASQRSLISDSPTFETIPIWKPICSTHSDFDINKKHLDNITMVG